MVKIHESLIYSACINFLTNIIGLFIFGWTVYGCRSLYNWKFHKKIYTVHSPVINITQN